MPRGRLRVNDEVGVFGGDCATGDPCGVAESGVRKTVIGVADGADQASDGAKISGGFGSGCAITDGFAVGGEGESGGRFGFVEELVEDDDLAGNFVVTEGLEFVEGVDGDDIGGETVGRSGRGALCRRASRTVF